MEDECNRLLEAIAKDKLDEMSVEEVEQILLDVRALIFP